MSRFVYRTATALSGHLADAENSLEWLFAVSDAEGVADPSAGVGAIVQGSTTYEWVLAQEGLVESPGRWAEFYGDTPVFVFTSRELPRPEGADVRFVSGPVAPLLPGLRAAAGAGDVWLVGGGDLVGQFFDAGALDEITLTVAPVFLPAGAPLLPRRIESDRLTLAGVRQAGQFAELRYLLA